MIHYFLFDALGAGGAPLSRPTTLSIILSLICLPLSRRRETEPQCAQLAVGAAAHEPLGAIPSDAQHLVGVRRQLVQGHGGARVP